MRGKKAKQNVSFRNVLPYLRKVAKTLSVGLAVLWFCCAHFVPVYALPEDTAAEAAAMTAETEPSITITLTFRELITNTRYFEREKFVLPVGADLQILLDACVEQGLLREFLFEEELLSSMVFPNGVMLSAGDYGAESGFDITVGGRNRLPFADFTLEDGAYYLLNFRASKSDRVSIQTQTEDVREDVMWNDSLEAMLDSACSWLYQNRTRGNADAVTALGVAHRSANPTDVVLLTQMEGIDLQDLSAQTAYFTALAYCGYSPPIYQNKLLFSNFISFSDPKDCTTLMLCDIMRYYDSFSLTVDNDAMLSQNHIIGELLQRQNKDGGFSMNREGGSGIRATANVIAVLQNYRDLEVVQNAVLGGISYLSSPVVRNLLFEGGEYTDCVTVAQMILAISCCELPMQDIYFTYNGKTYADLLQACFCVSGGFSMYQNEKADETATVAAIEALCALRMGGNPYLREDVTLVSFSLDVPQQKKEILPPVEEEQPPVRQVSSGFWLAAIFTVVMILVEVVHYIIYRRQVDKMD